MYAFFVLYISDLSSIRIMVFLEIRVNIINHLFDLKYKPLHKYFLIVFLHPFPFLTRKSYVGQFFVWISLTQNNQQFLFSLHFLSQQGNSHFRLIWVFSKFFWVCYRKFGGRRGKKCPDNKRLQYWLGKFHSYFLNLNLYSTWSML